VGFDDNKELNLEGAKSALPIWVEFMKRAHQHRPYKNVTGWDAPDAHVAGWETTPASPASNVAAAPAASATANGNGTQPEPYRTVKSTSPVLAGSAPVPLPTEKPKEKKGIFGRIKDIFR
jgi:membrane carboxypeptidase/penicillin-binding protein